MQHFIYEWTRISTGEYYIGLHSGSIDDNYVGSGIRFKNTYKQNPADWTRSIISYHNSREEAGVEERFIVDESRLLDVLCLNLCIGGGLAPVMRGSDNPNYGKKMSDEQKLKLSVAKKGVPSPMKGTKQSERICREKSERSKRLGLSVGSKNSQYGKFGADHPASKSWDIFDHITDEIIAENVSLHSWCKDTPYDDSSLGKTATGKKIQHKGIYARRVVPLRRSVHLR